MADGRECKAGCGRLVESPNPRAQFCSVACGREYWSAHRRPVKTAVERELEVVARWG